MQNILRNRIFRELKNNLLKYLALCLLTMLGMYLVVSLVGAAETIITGVDKMAEVNMVEDGEFTLLMPLNQIQEDFLKEKGITLAKNYYMDCRMEDDSIIRIFSNRNYINKTALDEGKLAETAGEGVLEKRYAAEHGLQAEDKLHTGQETIEIVGIGSVPDYDGLFKELSDSSADSRQFGLLFVTQEQYDRIKLNGGSVISENYTYSYRLNEKLAHEELLAYVKDLIVGENMAGNRLLMFLEGDNNPRIKASAEDQSITRTAGLIAGVLVMVLLAYVISVFVIHNIESQSCVIGGLFALGVRSKDLLLHYLMLPVIITFIGGSAGTWLGFGQLGVRLQMESVYGYFSLPELPTVYPLYLVLYGLVMPAAAAALVNSIVIYGKLNRPALRLLRNEHKESRIRNLKLGNMGFIGRFQVRYLLRETRTGITVIFGMFIGLLVMMLGVDCLVMCSRIISENEKDARFQYMYVYKYQEETVPEGAEACYMETLTGEIYGKKQDVIILGIDSHNPYFPFPVEKGENKIILSSAAAIKFGLKTGDEFILDSFQFTVEGIQQYSIGLYVFMDIDSMRSLFGRHQSYVNVVFGGGPLDVDMSKVFGVTRQQDIIRSSQVFLELMIPLICMLLTVSVILFSVVMYLMMKVMIDRSSLGVSLVKILGYSMKEVKKLYLRGNIYIICAGAAVCIPAAKKLIDMIFPYMIYNVAIGVDISFTWQMYGIIYGGVIFLAVIINALLVRKLEKISPSVILKNRE